VWGGGGGISELFNVPTWQTSVNSGSDSGRGMPDLVYLSDIYPAVTLYFQGGWVGEGNGTSQAAPTFAAMVMLLNQSLDERVGLVNPALYSLGADTPSAYFDITTGDNIIGNQFEQFKVSCCTASAGYDFASGRGIMNVNTAANNWPE
jgi:kumamolisin